MSAAITIVRVLAERWGRRSSLRRVSSMAIDDGKWPARSDDKLCDQEMNEEIEFAAYIAGRVLSKLMTKNETIFPQRKRKTISAAEALGLLQYPLRR